MCASKCVLRMTLAGSFRWFLCPGTTLYSDYFFDPFDDESPQDKATREEEEKEEAELEEAEEAMWSSFSVGGGCTKS